MKTRIFSAVSVLALSLGVSSARAQLSNFNLIATGGYVQTSGSSAPVTATLGSWQPGNSFSMLFVVGEQNPGDFTTASFAYPGSGSPISALNWINGPIAMPADTLYIPPTAVTVGGEAIAGSGNTLYPSFSALNAAYPAGTYTSTVGNSTGATQSASINYDPSQQISSAPALTLSSWNQLQGLNPAAPFQFNFVNPLSPSEPGSQVELLLGPGFITAAPGAPLIIQPNTLVPNTTYKAIAVFENKTTSVVSGVTETVVFGLATEFSFTTGNAAPVQVVTLPGGSATKPTQLSGTGIGQVNGTIGGLGSEEFYEFSWAGGAFTVDASVTGANANGSYDFSLYGPSSLTMVADATLDSTDAFTAPIDLTALAGGIILSDSQRTAPTIRTSQSCSTPR